MRILVCSTPTDAHVAPLLEVARGLGERGHELAMLTGTRFERAVHRSGASFYGLPKVCDYDDRDLEGSFPGRSKKRGSGLVNFDLQRLYVDPIPHQYAALEVLCQNFRPEVVVIDPLFFGALPFVLRREELRPPLVVCSMLPLMLSSRDTAPFGLGWPPPESGLDRLRYAALGTRLRRVAFASSKRHMNRVLESIGCPPLPVSAMDSAALADLVVQLTAPSFEYPRSDLPSRVHFVGPVLPARSERFDPPPWWPDLDEARPVVNVTQSSMDMGDPGRLFGATFEALANEDVLVVATIGARSPIDFFGALPRNGRVAEVLPYDHFLHQVDVMVTDGGYAGIHGALSNGIPLVVAGAREGNQEAAERVAWSGAGIHIRTGRPKPAKIRDAVREVLENRSYRARANAFREEFLRCDPVGSIERLLAEVAAERGSGAGSLRAG